MFYGGGRIVFRINNFETFVLGLMAIALGVVAAVYIFGRGELQNIDREVRRANFSSRAPSFELAEITDDRRIHNATIREFPNGIHRPVLLHFFASWCAVCKSEQSHLNRFIDEVGSELEVLSLASYDDMPRLQRAIGDWPIATTVLWDKDGDVAQKYKVGQLPASFLVSSEGRIVESFLGPIGPKELKGIRHWLSQQAALEKSTATMSEKQTMEKKL